MLGTGINAQITELHATKRPTRNHALDGLLHHALGETTLEDRFRGAFLDAADVASVIVIDLVVAFTTSQHGMSRVDDDDMVPAVDVRRVGGEVFAAKAHCDQ